MNRREECIQSMTLVLICAVVYIFLTYASTQSALLKWACVLFCLCDIMLIAWWKKKKDAKVQTFIEANKDILRQWNHIAVAILLVSYTVPMFLPNARSRYVSAELSLHLLLLYQYVQAICQPSRPLSTDINDCAGALAPAIYVFSISEQLLPNILTYISDIANLLIIIAAFNRNSLLQMLEDKISAFVRKHFRFSLIATSMLGITFCAVLILTPIHAIFRLAMHMPIDIANFAPYVGYTVSAVNAFSVVVTFDNYFLK